MVCIRKQQKAFNSWMTKATKAFKNKK